MTDGEGRVRGERMVGSGHQKACGRGSGRARWQQCLRDIAQVWVEGQRMAMGLAGEDLGRKRHRRLHQGAPWEVGKAPRL